MTSIHKPRGAKAFLPLEGAPFPARPRRAVPHEFVLDALAEARPMTRPMFGCLAIYVGGKIVLALRDKQKNADDNGVWLATTPEHHDSLRREFPSMRSIRLLGKAVTGWQVLPADAPDFEEAALRACELIVAQDHRIGKVPGARQSSRRPHQAAAKLGKRAESARKPLQHPRR